MTNGHLALPAIARFKRFDILGRLAVGGMAEIFLAREEGPGRGARAVVVKRILPHVANDPRFVEMFLHEAELAMNLSHPNLCAIYEFGEQDGEYFIAMEWVRGVSITQMHKALFERGDAGIAAPVVARVGAEIADALHYAHQARDQEGRPLKLVHRDVTPDNIMVSFDGKVKLLDFGVAKAASQRLKTEAGMLKGKFAYMSPEQYQGLEIDGRADVFSLGACLYEAVTGLALFHRASEYETMGAIVGEDPAPRTRKYKPEVPPGLDEIIAKALEKNRDVRYQSAKDLHDAIERFFVKEGKVFPARDAGAYAGELCAALRDGGPTLDTRPETWTRESAEGQKSREAMRDALSVQLEADTEELARASSGKAWLVRGVIAAVVLGLVALVVANVLGVGAP
jgi:serine/threonine protein kinase